MRWEQESRLPWERACSWRWPHGWLWGLPYVSLSGLESEWRWESAWARDWGSAWPWVGTLACRRGPASGRACESRSASGVGAGVGVSGRAEVVTGDAVGVGDGTGATSVVDTAAGVFVGVASGALWATLAGAVRARDRRVGGRRGWRVRGVVTARNGQHDRSLSMPGRPASRLASPSSPSVGRPPRPPALAFLRSPL